MRLGELLKNVSKKYDIHLCAGSGGESKKVKWVYYGEDIENMDFIKDEQLVITTGYFKVGGISLGDFISELIKREKPGLIVNTGKYIFDEDITDDIKKMCDRESFALYTMPWRVHISDITQTMCAAIIADEGSRCEESIKRVIISQGSDTEAVQTVKSVLGGKNHRMLCTSVDTMRGLSKSYRGYFIEAENRGIIIASDDFEHICAYIAEKGVCAGVSDEFFGGDGIVTAYRQSRAAAAASELEHRYPAHYNDIGVLALIFEADSELLRSIYKRKIGILEEYDSAHSTQLTDTLFAYLYTGGSLAEAAKMLFIHRNTVSYRMEKIRSICQSGLESEKERYDYLTSLYIMKALKLREE